METAQKRLLLVVKATLQVPDLLMHGAILLGHAPHLLGEVLNFLGITNKTAPLLHNDALSVVLQLEQVLGIFDHVRPATVVVNLKDNVHSIVHVGTNSPRGPRAPVRKHRVGWDIDVDLVALPVVLLIEPTIVFWALSP
jgi:hypothetical protein